MKTEVQPTMVQPLEPEATFADDLLEGAGSIAKHIYDDERKRRRIYHLVEKHGLPTFRLGAKICARKSVINKWIAAQEHRASAL